MSTNILQLIEDFKRSFTNEKYRIVKQMENLREWRVASEYWRKLGSINDAEACEMIADAIDKGNELRSK
jgi:hypothetical protein